MTPHGALSHQVEIYHSWKKELIRQIGRYRLWLQDNRLYSDDISERIHEGLRLLVEDELTIAFVGEYSRGKTELINALFFSDFGQRMLPSQAGRTTMCPTELFFDRNHQENYLLLLPIETRVGELSLQQLRAQPERWLKHQLDPENPDQMRQILEEVARVKSVTPTSARMLGFDEQMLELDRANPGQVLIPAWRNAQISIRHPLFERGLRILDTPGLNALGSEPELTISLLPKAHAIIFVLSADTGVTASDLAIWRDFIATDQADHRAGRFAVMNKIDVLWDELQGEASTLQAIERVRNYSADHLGIQPQDVIPVSAKQGLVGRVKNDFELFQRSGIEQLEELIIQRILAHKEKLITGSLINDLLGMLQNSQAALHSQLGTLREEQQAYSGPTPDKAHLKRLAEKTQTEYEYYYKKLIILRSSRRLVEAQGVTLQELVAATHFETQVTRVRENMSKSWTTVGMNRAIDQFFDGLEGDLSHLLTESRLAERMVTAIYKRYSDDPGARHIEPAPFPAGRHVIAIRKLRQKSERFRNNPRNLLTEQSVLVRRFSNLMINEVRNLYLMAQQDAERWPRQALLPVMQYTLEQKQLLQHQIGRLKELAHNDRHGRAETKRLEDAISDLQRQLELAEAIHRQIRKPAPTFSQQKAVKLSSAM
ncbi:MULTISPECIES: dynamin family protein [unclassified Marinobacter]|uniref:dynamin family protein n=1 Tax=unclassified Marinobacter TaxID=83889 RepID=UPI00200FAAFF|nr:MULTISPECIES: dynamin family protein [unclassified Marinobacter]MCL1476534.1 dynamin family protein [Marinobacter sp.]MCL1483689.1 dynamin family protein [Marinobacter sp.]UQG56662.1 dynamin family protein [Marinobacter sp. M4C]UQG65466.1 dynamin family protein [Marinobacter sp. M2C]UQG69746.1 dynamin family protein [Marinobacter sp. M1C]